MANFKIHITLKREHFLIHQLHFEFITEDPIILNFLNQSLQFSPSRWLDPSLNKIPSSLISLLSSLKNLNSGILDRQTHLLVVETPIPENLIRSLLNTNVSWEIKDLFPIHPKHSVKPYFPQMSVNFFEKKLFLLNPDSVFLIPTHTRHLIVSRTEIRPLHPLFDSQPITDLFREGFLDSPSEWIESLAELPPKHPSRKWLKIPKTRQTGSNLSLAIKIEQNSDGFLLHTGLANPQNPQKSFIPLWLPKARQALLVQEAFILNDENEILIIAPNNPLYPKINTFVVEVYRHFFEFLGEIDENRIQTKDRKTLFHKFLPFFEPDLLILSENQAVQFHQANTGQIDIDLHNSDDLENRKIDWLKIDFKYKIEDIELDLKQIREILKNGYTISNQKWITLNSDSILELTELFENMHIETRKNESFIHRYQLGTLPDNTSAKKNKLSEFHTSLTKQKLFDSPNLSPELDKLLRDYQKFGISWFQFLDRFGFSGILADEMGLGKTLQVLTFLATKKNTGPALIICPSSLIYNWEEEIQHFFPNKLSYLIIDGKKELRTELIKQIPNYRLAITSYNMAHLDKEEYEKITVDYCIIDEAQHIKNKSAKRTRSIKDISAKNRIAISGTPIENNLTELWSIFDFLMPGFLGTHKEFRDLFEIPINGFDRKTAKKTLKTLKDRVSPFILRRTKAKVIRELPPKTEQIIRLELTEKQKSVYLETLKNVKTGTLEAIQNKGVQNTYMDFLAALTRLRQVCLHTGLVMPQEEPNETDSIKLKALIELIEEAMDSHHRVLVFSQFVQMLKLIRQEFHRQEIEYLYLDGKTRNRMSLVNQFNNSDIPVFLISLRAGGVGLNLTGADAVILFDPWWNPAVENQAIDRAHRIGQHNPVHVYRLITRGTIEDKIHILQKQKQGVSDSILSTEDHFMRNLSLTDIQKLFMEEELQIRNP